MVAIHNGNNIRYNITYRIVMCLYIRIKCNKITLNFSSINRPKSSFM